MEKNKPSRAPQSIITGLVVCLMVVFLVGPVSAFEFDNAISNYNETTETIIFRNGCLFNQGWTCMGDIIGEVQLKTPKNFKVARGYNYVWELDAVVYEDYNNFLKQFEYLDMKKKAKVNRDLDIKILSYKEVEVEDYYYSCKDVWNITNQSMSNHCNRIENGTHIEQKEVWTKVTPADLKKNDRVTLRGYTIVEAGDIIDWSPVIFGTRVNHNIWATWSETLTADSISNYKFNDDYIDSVGTYNGTGYGTSFVSGKLGNAIHFDSGGDDYINVGDMDFVGNSLTFNAWVKMDTITTFNAFFSKYSSSIPKDTKFALYNGNYYFSHNDGTWHTVDTGISYNGGHNWTMLTLVIDGTRMIIYENITVVYNATSIVGTLAGNTGDRYIGSFSEGGAGWSWDGDMDEVNFFSTALNQSAISYLYNNGTGRSYPFEESSSDSSPIITLNSPEDNYNSENLTVVFNCSASDDVNLINVSLYINGILNETNTSGINNTNYIFTKTLSVNDYNWTCKGTDNISQSTTASYRDLSIVYKSPEIILNSPSNASLVSNPVIFTYTPSCYSTGCTNASLYINTSEIILNDLTYYDIWTGLNAHQGVTRDDDYIYGLHTSAIYKYNATSLATVDTNSNILTDISASVNHCGDGDEYNGIIYLPCEQYSTPTGSNNVIALFNSTNLDYITEYSSTDTNLDEQSGLAINEEDGIIYIVGTNNNDGIIAKFNFTNFNFIEDFNLSVQYSSPTGMDTNGLVHKYNYLYVGANVDLETGLVQGTYLYRCNETGYCDKEFNITGHGGGEGYDWYLDDLFYATGGSDDLFTFNTTLEGEGGFKAVASNSSIITNGTTNTITYDFSNYSETSFKWNIKLTQNDEQFVFADDNYVLTLLNGTSLNITLTSPSNNSNFTAPNIEFVFNVTGENEVVNVSLYLDENLNETNTSGINNIEYIFNLDLSDGEHTIYGKVTDNESQTTNSDSIKIVIDSTAPTINITDNTDSYVYNLPINKSLNISTTDEHPGTCIYWTSDNTTNNTITCNTEINVSFTTGGNKTIYTWVNDTFGNTVMAQDSFYINYISVGSNWDISNTEFADQRIIFYLNATDVTTWDLNFSYNGVDYPIDDHVTNTGPSPEQYIMFVDITTLTPGVYNMTWDYSVNGHTNSTSINQTSNALTPLVVQSGACSDLAVTYIVQDEVNATNLTGSISYNIKYGSSTTYNEVKEIYGNIPNGSLNICINATQTPIYYIGYGELQYTSPDYVDRRYYMFEDSEISNSTYETKFLRDLETSKQTSFLLTLQDSDLNAYSNKYTALWRWYPDLNKYKIVEMGKTDSDGQTVAHVRTEDVDYRTALYELNGSLIKFDNPRRFLCTSSPCSLDIIVGETANDLTAFFDIEQSLSYNETTGIITYIFNDPNQLTQSMRLLVEKINPTTEITLCNGATSGYTGVLSCNISAYTGSFKATVYRTASPSVPIAQKIITIGNSVFKSPFGLFISIFLWLAIVLTGIIGGPILTIILAIVGLIPALFLGSINLAIFTGFAVLGAIVLHFIKRSLG